MLCLWPGLIKLWRLGEWSSLLTALVFGFLLNVAIASTFLWPEWFDKPFVIFQWIVVGLIWCFCFWQSSQFNNDEEEIQQLKNTKTNPLFIEAQFEYLNLRFSKCVSLLRQILKRNPRDLEARLLLATTFRRQAKFDESEQELQRLEGIDQSVLWKDEIEKEWELIERDRREILADELAFIPSPVTMTASLSSNQSPTNDAA